MPERPEIGVVILAGGEATRLPGKLELAAGDVPMIVRVYRNVSPKRTTFISCRGGFAPEVDALLDCPMVVDRWERRGPLCGLLSTMLEMETALVFAVAGDAPFVDGAFIERLAAAWRPGDEAVVPAHEVAGKMRLEPLAALYDREAFVREGQEVLHGAGSLLAVLDRLAVRRYPVAGDDVKIFTNVNTPEDYANAVAWMS